MQQLLLCVTYTAKHGMRETFVNEIISKGLFDIIHKESGCLGYEYYYSASNDDEVLLVEQWETEELQKQHMRQTHMEDLKSIKECYIIDTHLKKFFVTDTD